MHVEKAKNRQAKLLMASTGVNTFFRCKFYGYEQSQSRMNNARKNNRNLMPSIMAASALLSKPLFKQPLIGESESLQNPYLLGELFSSNQ